MEALKNCPHCGATPKLHTTPDGMDGPGISTVQCGNCGAHGGAPRMQLWRCASNGNTEAQGIAAHDAEAVRLWNARV